MLGDARDVFEEKKVLERQYSAMSDYLQEKHTIKPNLEENESSRTCISWFNGGEYQKEIAYEKIQLPDLFADVWSPQKLNDGNLWHLPD